METGYTDPEVSSTGTGTAIVDAVSVTATTVTIDEVEGVASVTVQ